MDNPNVQFAALAISAADFVLLWGVALYMHIINKNKVTNERVGAFQKDVDGKLDGHGERISKLEGQRADAPTHEDLSGIHEKINQVDASVNLLAGEFKGVRNLLTSLHEHMLRSAK